MTKAQARRRAYALIVDAAAMIVTAGENTEVLANLETIVAKLKAKSF